MAKLRPIHALVLVAVIMASVMVANYALEGGFSRGDYARVAPDTRGQVEIDLSDLEPWQVRHYRFLNRGNQEVLFFVGRDGEGHVQVAFDACEACFKLKRGYRAEGEWVTCNKCDKSFRLATVNEGGGGCNPVPLVHRVDGTRLLLAEADVLKGWRFFR